MRLTTSILENENMLSKYRKERAEFLPTFWRPIQQLPLIPLITNGVWTTSSVFPTILRAKNDLWESIEIGNGKGMLEGSSTREIYGDE